MNDREIRIAAARQWGEKAGWDDGEPQCPYVDVAASQAWWDGFRQARQIKKGLDEPATNCAAR